MQTHTHTGRDLLFQLEESFPCADYLTAPLWADPPSPPPAHSSLSLIRAQVALSPFVKPPSPTSTHPSYPLPLLPPPPPLFTNQLLHCLFIWKWTVAEGMENKNYNGRKEGLKQRQGNKKQLIYVHSNLWWQWQTAPPHTHTRSAACCSRANLAWGGRTEQRDNWLANSMSSGWEPQTVCVWCGCMERVERFEGEGGMWCWTDGSMYWPF